ncbi:inositol polyphosphate kinase-domain-containing protein [Lipomyces kononenkoae]|uniref:Inositol polyphosphate kinase-domain-containing protein n=1 Tax=Lipomyces kononenkoae TaxID=34357 RepID=A0ACC3T5H3_LIPKO
MGTPLEINISSAVSFENKVAGHDGVLQDPSGVVVIKPASQFEIEFYESLMLHPVLASVAPKFYGVLELSEDMTTTDASGEVHRTTGAERAVVIENITAGFTKPSVIDVKLGRQLWDEQASIEKRKRLDDVAAKTTSGSLAMRIAGMKTWDQDKEDYVAYDKYYGRNFDSKTVHQGIDTYIIKALGTDRRKEVIRRIITGISQIAEALEKEESRMYSASILAVYESDVQAFDEALKEELERPKKVNDEYDEQLEEEFEVLESETVEVNGQIVEQVSIAGAGHINVDEDEDEDERPVCRVNLIDFAHATWTPGEGKDENALEGVYNLQRLFEELLSAL